MTDQKNESEIEADRFAREARDTHARYAPDGTFIPEDEEVSGVADRGSDEADESEFDRGVAFGWKSASGLIQTHRDMQEKATARAEAAESALAIANTGGLKLLYEIREAVGFNDKTSLSLLPDRCRRLFEIASRNEGF